MSSLKALLSAYSQNRGVAPEAPRERPPYKHALHDSLQTVWDESRGDGASGPAPAAAVAAAAPGASFFRLPPEMKRRGKGLPRLPPEMKRRGKGPHGGFDWSICVGEAVEEGRA